MEFVISNNRYNLSNTRGRIYKNSKRYWEEISIPTFIFDYEARFIISTDARKNDYSHLQNFSGIQLYLKLLQIYNNQSDSYKKPFNVILFSTLTLEQLLAIKPEITILRHPKIKFIQIEKDTNFENKVAIALKDSNCLKYNVAADNLLKGYYFQQQENMQKSETNINENESVKIQIPKGRRLMIIDDFYNEYEWTYKKIFSDFSQETVITPNMDLLIQWRENKNAQTEKDAIDHIMDLVTIEKPDYILSDFYIGERHKDTNAVKGLKDVKKISGYKVFKKINEHYPWIPYMLYTTSNKIWNYDTLRQEGIWCWSIKDTRINLPISELKENYYNFKSNLEKIMNEEWAFAAKAWKLLRNTAWNKFNLFPARTLSPKESDKNKMANELNSTVEDAFHLLNKMYKDYYNPQNKFEEINDIGLHSAGIISKLGGLCERYRYHFRGKSNAINNVGCCLFLFRAFATHQKFHETLRPIEVIFFLDLIVNMFNGRYTITSNKLFPQDVSLILEKDFQQYGNYNYHIQFKEKADSNSWYYSRDIFDMIFLTFKHVSNWQNIVSNRNSNAVNIIQNFINNQV